MGSLPSRERGLKLAIGHCTYLGQESLPSRERGLKFDCIPPHSQGHGVAPFAGAWIEISNRTLYLSRTRVAPFAGAWIEIFALVKLVTS